MSQTFRHNHGYTLRHGWPWVWDFMHHWRGVLPLLRQVFWVLIWGYDGEGCQFCGRPYKLVWWAPPDLWDRVIVDPGALCCPTCFTDRADDAGIFIRWQPQRQEPGQP